MRAVSAAAEFTHGVLRKATVFSEAFFSRGETRVESCAFSGAAISLIPSGRAGYLLKRPPARAVA